MRFIDKIALLLHKVLLSLSALAMVLSFLIVLLGVISRMMRWDIAGLDAYAGYAIAATLFLALPATLLAGKHIRVTLLIGHLPAFMRPALQRWCLVSGFLIACYMTWFATRLVYISLLTQDVSTAADATPLWIPQLSLVIGCIGFSIAFLQAIVHEWCGSPLIQMTASEATAQTE